MEQISEEELSSLKKEFLYELEFGGKIEGTPEEREAVCYGPPGFRSPFRRIRNLVRPDPARISRRSRKGETQNA